MPTVRPLYRRPTITELFSKRGRRPSTTLSFCSLLMAWRACKQRGKDRCGPQRVACLTGHEYYETNAAHDHPIRHPTCLYVCPFGVATQRDVKRRGGSRACPPKNGGRQSMAAHRTAGQVHGEKGESSPTDRTQNQLSHSLGIVDTISDPIAPTTSGPNPHQSVERMRPIWVRPDVRE